MRRGFVEDSMVDARKRYGEAFKLAYWALTSLDSKNPKNRAIVQVIWYSDNPGLEVVRWYVNGGVNG